VDSSMTRLALAFALFASPAASQNCAPPETAAANLWDRYGEAVQSRGLASTGHLVEIWVSETGSWSITLTAPGGMTCMVAAGEGYHTMPMTAPGDDT